MLRAIALLLLSFSLFAEDKEAARKLLESAAEIAATARPEVQVFALMHLGSAYDEIDDVKSIRYLRQAFSVAAAAPEDIRETLRGEVVSALADVSLPDAIELLRSMPEPATNLEMGFSAIERVVVLLLEDSEFDRAAEVIGLVPESAAYPFQAANKLFEKLPKDDPRRVLVFGRALSAYKRAASGEFTELLWKHWRVVPREMADAAVQAVVNAVQANKDSSYSWTIGDDGKVVMNGKQTTELSQLYHVLNELDPNRAQKLAASNAAIKAASAQPPQEKKEAEPPQEGFSADDFSPPASMFRFEGSLETNGFLEKFTNWFKQNDKAESILKTAETELQTALSQISELTYDSLQAETMCKIARKSAAKDRQTGRNLFEKCMTAIGDIKNPLDRMSAMLDAAEAAYALKQKDTSIEAFRKALASASEAYTRESGAEMVNQVLREYWPSVQFGRVIAWRAGKLLGSEAEPLLHEVREPDVNVLCRIEMALALMGESTTVHHMGFRFSKTN